MTEAEQLGFALLLAEVELRGGRAERDVGRENIFTVTNAAGDRFRAKVKTKTSGDWQTSKNDRLPRPPSRAIDVWLLIDVRLPAADAYIAPAEWMREDAVERVETWAQAVDGRDPAKKTHRGIKDFDVAEWRGRWDLLGLGNEASTVNVGAKDELVNQKTLGAWVLKCNPDVYDLPSAIADGNLFVDNWSVVRNYRSQMFAAGQKAILWMSGDYTEYAPRGVWGIGWVTGPRYDVRDVASEHWLDKQHAAAVELMAPTAITVLDRGDRVLATDIVNDPLLGSMEVFTSPRGSNPSWVTREQLAALEAMLPAWPDPSDVPTVPISVGAGGAGYGTPEHNREVELAAMTAVTDYYERRWGAEVTDVSAENLGWDLTATSSEWGERHVEVKGTSGSKPVVLLTANELHSAETDTEWELAVVTSALTSQRFVNLYDADQVTGNAAAHVVRVDLTDEEGWED